MKNHYSKGKLLKKHLRLGPDGNGFYAIDVFCRGTHGWSGAYDHTSKPEEVTCPKCIAKVRNLAARMDQPGMHEFCGFTHRPSQPCPGSLGSVVNPIEGKGTNGSQ